MYDFQRIENFTLLAPQIINVFHNSFSASEGEREGALIRTLVEHLLGNTPEPDIFIFAARHHDTVIGCAIFSRLTYSDDARNVFILSPMAVHPDYQKNGIGQTLLRESIAVLKSWHRHFNDLRRSKFLRQDWVFTRDRTAGTTAISAEHAYWLDRSIPRRNLPFTGVLNLRFGAKQPCHLVRAFHAIVSQHRGQWELFIGPIWPPLLTGVLRAVEWHLMEFPKHRDRRIYIVARPATAKIVPNTDVKQIAIFGQKMPARGGPFSHQLYYN